MKEIAKHIYLKLKFLLTQPSEAWERFSNEDEENYIRTMIIPLLCAVVFCMFLGQILSSELDVHKWTFESFKFVFSYLFGYFISKHLLQMAMPNLDEKKSTVLVVYSYSIMLLTDVFSAFLNDEDLIRFLFYVVAMFLLYKSEPIFNSRKWETVKYVSVTMLVIVVMPFLLRKILGGLMSCSDLVVSFVMKYV